MSFELRSFVAWLREAGIDFALSDANGGSIETPDHRVEDVIFDHREAGRASMFCAVAGENTHGARFVEPAFESGVGVALVEGPVPRLGSARGIVVEVADARAALAAAARAWLVEHDPFVIAITGSNGKTTTKDFSCAALAGEGKISASPGNKNSAWGMPAAILGFEGDESTIVLEMGASEPDEIGRLVAIAKPEVGCVTNIAPAHLQFFGSIEEVVRTKSQLVEGLPRDGVAVLNHDDAHFESVRQRCASERVLSFGHHRDADVRIESAETVASGLSVRIAGAEALLPWFGRANALNAAAAVAIAGTRGIDAQTALSRIVRASISPHRSRIETIAGRSVIDDCYNANPSSVVSALESLDSAPGGAKLAVLGDMAELGRDELRMHREVVEIAIGLAIDRLVLVGSRFGEAMHGIDDSRIHIATDSSPDVIARDLIASSAAGDVILLKASRSGHLERVLEALRAATDSLEERHR